MNKDVRPFEEYKEIIQDMSKENMIKGLYDLSKNCIEKDEEISRLNNIINELEKWAKSIQLPIYRSDDMPVYQRQDVLDKLKELKGDDEK